MKVHVNGVAGKTEAKDMKIGQIAVIIDGGSFTWRGHLLRTFSDFVLLESPGTTWKTLSNVYVDILPPGTKITLEIE